MGERWSAPDYDYEFLQCCGQSTTGQPAIPVLSKDKDSKGINLCFALP